MILIKAAQAHADGIDELSRAIGEDVPQRDSRRDQLLREIAVRCLAGSFGFAEEVMAAEACAVAERMYEEFTKRGWLAWERQQ